MPVRDARTVLETETALKRGIKGTMHMRHVHESEAKPKGNFAKRIVAAVAAVAMLGGMGYATTSTALANDVNATVEQQNGISIGLHDYDRNSINNNHALHFMSGGNEAGYNRYVQDGRGAYAGIVKPLLTNDYPTMADGNESLDYLFGGASDNAVTNYTPDGGLLTPDGQGNYSFDAASKYAKYDHNSNRFELTNQTQSGNRDPLFTPFGNDSDDNRYSFGMNLGADFYMPKDGKVNNQNMVFDFTGDDDVWVFIDDVLVLDLGGIHQALGGSIDFAADKIKYDKVQSHGDTPAATITEAFRKAGKKWDSKAYTTHHLSFFYLERGDGGSNCKISFNLPVKPSKAIDIEKQTLGTIPADQQFQFQLFANGSQTPYEGKYSVYDASTNQVVSSGLNTGSNGVITLAKGRFARVQSNDFSDDTTYSVRELNSGKYTVSANGEALSQHNDGNGGSYAETHSFKVSDTSHVTVINSNVKPQNNKTIEKVDGDGDQYELHLNASGDSASSETTTVTPADITVDIKQGNDTYKTVTLKRDDSGKWSTDVIIPAGAQKTYTVTEVEPDSHLWKASYQHKVGDGNLADGNAVTVPESTASQEATVIITNTLKQTMLTHAIGVQKELKGRDWKDSDEFTFKLKADDSNPDAPMPASCKNQSACTVTVKRDSSDDHVAYFGDITYDAGEAEYTYLVTENAGNVSAMYYSQAEYRVVVSVMKDGTSGEWRAVVESVTQLKTDYGVAGSNWDSTRPMLFTNKYISASSLPLTGRMGAERWWQLAASGIGVLALLAVAAADQWRRKKRLG